MTPLGTPIGEMELNSPRCFYPTQSRRLAALRGRDAIAADCHKCSENPPRKTRHIWSNLRFGEAAVDMITTTIIQQTFERNGADRPTQLRQNDVTDAFRRNEAGEWLFTSRLVKRELALSIPS
jgi:hypothetical protein